MSQEPGEGVNSTVENSIKPEIPPHHTHAQRHQSLLSNSLLIAYSSQSGRADSGIGKKIQWEMIPTIPSR